MESNILGLDLGPNSIGWAVMKGIVTKGYVPSLTGIAGAGSRILPMDAAMLGNFEKGNTVSQTADKRKAHGMRKLHERSILRRERTLWMLDLMGFLPEHYARQLDRYGKFLPGKEPKLAWKWDECTNRYEFIFQEAFQEMLDEFKRFNPQYVAGGKQVPYDWTIYFLRKKALTQSVSKEELAWILLNFNQKRGYYQLRDEKEAEQAKENKREEYYALKVVAVEDTGEKNKNGTWHNVVLENGWIYRRTSNVPLSDWIGKTKEFIVTTDLEKDGTEKRDRNVKRSFRSPGEDDWSLLKVKTQADIDRSHKTVGEYIYNTLLHHPQQKIRGKLVRTIERHYYRDELIQILRKQVEFHPELADRQLYATCIETLYPKNEAHRKLIAGRDFIYLFVDDILFYQRPLKSKKSQIADCPYECHAYFDGETKEVKHVPLKCIAKSHPLFQEFRLWQFIQYLRIYQKEKVLDGKICFDVDVTSEFLRTEDDYVALFDWLNGQKDIKQDAFFKYEAFGLKTKEINNYRWNYVEDKLYPCGETHALLLERLKKAGIDTDFLTREREERLWHILYSVSVKEELDKALASFARKQGLDIERFVQAFSHVPPFKKDYGAYSAKAIKKLLPLMRMGKYWDEAAIDTHTRTRIEKIVSGECDESIRTRVREKAIHLQDVSSFKGLPMWLACYVVYDRHSEAKEINKWKTPEDIDLYLASFKQHSLRNPIVEQVILETLRTVRDIWKQVGHIDEIHVELGREMKNPADKRAKISKKIQENENTNLRIKALLSEFLNPEFGIEDVRPHSPYQQDLLKIYEADVLNSETEVPDYINEIIRKFNETDSKKRPTTSEVLRYKLWLEQKYRSPYTGAVIPLTKLFTPAYEIEHIIPRARYFDDSFSNKVICEAAVNKLKDKMLGYEFIKHNPGAKVELGGGQVATIFSVEEYERFIKEHYHANPTKMKKLLWDDIPEQFIERQLNDSRYISKLIKSLLSNIVREDDELEEMSKNVIVCTGGITDRLKKDWGINDAWNKIILPRFLRLNELTGSKCFTTVNTNGHVIPAMPLELQKGFNKKRIDHRHHAMDAIVIACANRNIVNYLNNESASKRASVSRQDLQHLLCDKQQIDDKGNYRWVIKKPWATFTQDVYATLQNIIVSFKQNLRVINKTTNYYQHYEEGKKKIVKQEKGDSWAIRKPLHKDTISGEVNLRDIKSRTLAEALKNPKAIVNKDLKKKLRTLLAQGLNEKQIKRYFEDNKEIWQDVDVKNIQIYCFSKETKSRFFATRFGNDLISVFKDVNSAEKAKDKISKITDTGIRKILLRHLEVSGNNPSLAFSPEGIERMNENIIELNDGKQHQPIYKVRIYEKADKFAVGQTGNKVSKYVEAAKGTNLFFAVYETEQEDTNTGMKTKKRSYATIPLNVVIDRQKRGLPSAPENEDGTSPKFVLSPNDLVYVPTEDELKKGISAETLDRSRIYKMVSCTGNRLYVVPYNVASMIIDKVEYTQLNKVEFTDEKLSVKETCIPLRIDRLGKINLR